MVKKKPAWKDVKSILAKIDKSELLKLIADLYSSNSENKLFIHSRYTIDENNLESYKNIISEALYPDVYKNKPLRLSVGKKAIADYFKATKNKAGQLELMVHYLESGNQFTVDYGDVDAAFYSSLESMFNRILVLLREQSSVVQDEYFESLEDIVVAAGNIGWGYSECISEMFAEYECDVE